MTSRQATAMQQKLQTNKNRIAAILSANNKLRISLEATSFLCFTGLACFVSTMTSDFWLLTPALHTTIFQQLSSKSAMPQGIKVTVPELHVRRVKEAFRQALGRELTLAEQQSLGIPTSVVSIRESSSFGSRVKVVKGINRRKTA